MSGGGGWGALALVLVGLWLVSEALKNPRRDVRYHRCWNCRRIIVPNTNPCPFCRVPISWKGNPHPSQQPTGSVGRFFVIAVITCMLFGSFGALILFLLIKPEEAFWFSHMTLVCLAYLVGTVSSTVSPPPQ